MASIHKRKRSSFYSCSFLSADGRWLKKSTKQSNRAKAMAVCVAWELAAKQARTAVLTAAQARKVVAEMVEHSTGEALTAYTVRSWVNQWLASKKGEATESTLTRYAQVLRDFLEYLGGKADSPLTSLIPGDIIAYRDKLREGGRAVSTVNITVKKIISGPFREAYLQGHILVNPVAGVKNLKDKGKKPRSIKEPFTREEVVQLLGEVEGEWRGLILLGATTGLRLGDAASLKWGDIKKGFIKLTTQKTGKDVELPIHADLAAFLRDRTRGIGLAPVFPELSKRKQSGRSGLSRQFRAFMDKAGVRSKEVAAHGEAGRTRFSKGFHSLRHTFISSLANAGVSADVRQKLSAHSDESVHLDYTHLEKETFRKAVEKIPRFA